MRPSQRTTAELEAELDFTLPTFAAARLDFELDLHVAQTEGARSLVYFETFHERADEQLGLPLKASRSPDGSAEVTTRWAVGLVTAGLCAWLTGHRASTTSGPASAKLFDYDDARYHAELAIVWAPVHCRICLVPEVLRWLFVPEAEPVVARFGAPSVAARAKVVNRALVEGFQVHEVGELEGGARVDLMELAAVTTT